MEGMKKIMQCLSVLTCAFALSTFAINSTAYAHCGGCGTGDKKEHNCKTECEKSKNKKDCIKKCEKHNKKEGKKS